MKQETNKKILNQLADHEQRLAVLEGKNENMSSSGGKKIITKANDIILSAIDFGVNARAFFKKYSPGLSGPKKFVLVLAYLSHGNLEQKETFEDISNQWGEVKGLLGDDIQTMYGTRAKEQDWVDSPQKGIYVLRPKWLGILSK